MANATANGPAAKPVGVKKKVAAKTANGGIWLFEKDRRFLLVTLFILVVVAGIAFFSINGLTNTINGFGAQEEVSEYDGRYKRAPYESNPCVAGAGGWPNCKWKQ